jgi:sulfite exporter TauE/SafE/copper chaperone CopZ
MKSTSFLSEPSKQKNFTFHVRGMHCASCVVLTETELHKHPNVVHATATLTTRTVAVSGDFGDSTADEVALMLSPVLKPFGYAIEARRSEPARRSRRELGIAFGIAVVLVGSFVALQRSGIVNVSLGGRLSYGAAAVVGLVASVSTCMAVVGGLVLSLSAAAAKRGISGRTQALFHSGRLISFFIGGGLLGTIGAAFRMSPALTFALAAGTGIVMVFMGLHLLDALPGLHRFWPALPRGVSRAALAFAGAAPFLVGAATFVLPCGFTQSMQVYALSTGSFVSGALTMLSFALGTLPILALVSASSFRVYDRPWAGLFFKSAGFIVILFGLLNILNSMAAAGLMPPVSVF